MTASISRHFRFSITLWMLLCSLFLTPCSRACIWLHGTTIEGKQGSWEGSIGVTGDPRTSHHGIPDDPDILRRAIRLKPTDRDEFFADFKYEPDDPVARANDAAVQALLRGDVESAVTQLQQIEVDHPGEYFTAANLGTAHELAGDDAKAIRWILEGIARNPASHMFTEWLHARILETKLALSTEPGYLKDHTITGADFTRLRDPAYLLSTRQGSVNADQLHHALWSQISVRAMFVKPKDPIVAQLLYELARVEAEIRTLENALSFLELAHDYGLPEEQYTASKKSWSGIIWRATTFNAIVGNVFFWPVTIILMLVLLFYLRRRLGSDRF
jgi:hypothetical protein